MVEDIGPEGVPHGEHVELVHGLGVAPRHFGTAHERLVLSDLVPAGGTGILPDHAEDVDGSVGGDLAEDHGVIAIEVHRVVFLVDGVQPDVGLLGEFVPHRGLEVDAVGVLLVDDVNEDVSRFDGAGQVGLLVVGGGRGSVGVTLQTVVGHVDGTARRVVDLQGFVVGPAFDVFGDEELIALGGEQAGGQGGERHEDEVAHGVRL